MEDLSEIWVSIRLTIELAGVTTVILLIMGTPLAWWLARSKTIWSEAVATRDAVPQCVSLGSATKPGSALPGLAN